jgi:hypothetical protein
MQLNENQEVIVNSIINGNYNTKEISNETGLKIQSVMANIGAMIKKNVIKKVIENEVNKYEVAEEIKNLFVKEKKEYKKSEFGYWPIIESCGEPVLYMNYFNKNNLNAMRMTDKHRWIWKNINTAKRNFDLIFSQFPSARLAKFNCETMEFIEIVY